MKSYFWFLYVNVLQVTPPVGMNARPFHKTVPFTQYVEN